MDIVDNLEGWVEEYQSNWLAHFYETGEVLWKLYNKPVNQEAPAGNAVDLSQSRLIVISTAGGYLPASQAPFDAENDLGDYDIRLIPVTTDPAEIAIAHTHYDHTAINADQQVLIPFGHLSQLVEEGVIGEVAPDMISFMGYQPDVEQVVKKMIPAIVENAKAQGADAALLIPA